MRVRLQRTQRLLPDSSVADERFADHDGTGDRLAGPVAVLIAVATLIGAVAAFQQADTSGLADNRRLEATSLGLQAAASSQRGQEQAQVEFQAYLRAVEQQTQAANATLRELYAGEDAAELKRWQLERERWQRLADATLAATEIKPEAEFGPLNDSTFPRRYFARAAQESHRLNALQDAYNEQATLLDQRAASYTAILAVVAVAVYLLGLTLAVREYLLRRVFLGVGLLLMLSAGVWIVIAAGDSVPPIRPEAAEAYAAARVELETAYDRRGFADAKSLYDEAIALRPTYARAYVERATATLFASTPQQTGLISLVPPEALEEARADLREGLRHGAVTAGTYGSIGFWAYLEGIQRNDRAALEESVTASRRAIELDPAEPVYRLNLGVALVALERYTEAEAAYAEGVARVIYIDGDPERPRNEPEWEEQRLAGALTDLEVMARHRPQQADRVKQYKESLVGRIGTSSPQMPAPADVAASGLQLDLYPTRVQWQATLAGFDAASDVVSVQWYREVGDGDWAVVPEISTNGTAFLGSDGRHGAQTFYLGAVTPAACLPAGSYRAEVYVNGRLLLTDQQTSTFGALAAAAESDITVAFCRPDDWQPISEPLPGLVRGYTSADESRGAYVMRLAMPHSFSEVEQIATLTIDTTMSSFASLFPAPPEYSEDDGTTDHAFVGLARTAWRWYTYTGGYVRVAAGVTTDGAVILGFVFGPQEWFESDTHTEPYEVINSMIRYGE